MKEETWYTILSTVIPFINIVLWIIVIYALVKLYKKIIKFLDKNS